MQRVYVLPIDSSMHTLVFFFVPVHGPLPAPCAEDSEQGEQQAAALGRLTATAAPTPEDHGACIVETPEGAGVSPIPVTDQKADKSTQAALASNNGTDKDKLTAQQHKLAARQPSWIGRQLEVAVKKIEAFEKVDAPDSWKAKLQRTVRRYVPRDSHKQLLHSVAGASGKVEVVHPSAIGPSAVQTALHRLASEDSVEALRANQTMAMGLLPLTLVGCVIPFGKLLAAGNLFHLFDSVRALKGVEALMALAEAGHVEFMEEQLLNAFYAREDIWEKAPAAPATAASATASATAAAADSDAGATAGARGVSTGGEGAQEALLLTDAALTELSALLGGGQHDAVDMLQRAKAQRAAAARAAARVNPIDKWGRRPTVRAGSVYSVQAQSQSTSGKAGQPTSATSKPGSGCGAQHVGTMAAGEAEACEAAVGTGGQPNVECVEAIV